MKSQNEKGGFDGRLNHFPSIFPANAGESPAATHNTTQKNYLPEAAPAAWGFISAIFSSRAFMLLPVSRVASTA